MIADELAADDWQVTDTADRKTVVLLVSKEGHCLYELLSRWHSKELGADIAVVIGNHTDLEPVAALFGLPFTHIPVPPDDDGKAAAFAGSGGRSTPTRRTRWCSPGTCRSFRPGCARPGRAG